MVLAASFEFNRQYNQEVVERPSDNEQIPRVSTRRDSGTSNRQGSLLEIIFVPKPRRSCAKCHFIFFNINLV